ncbi:MAG TPA: hypothetical protein VK163_13505 [Opitutaceae bacterium]|nr:hypothetical protein [Opitutaceae bacterium]
MHLNGGKQDAWHRALGHAQLPTPHDSATRRALTEALRRAQECHDRHRLLKPQEAMAVACRDGHTTETLYSIARNAAFASGGDVDTVLKHLEHAWPDFA